MLLGGIAGLDIPLLASVVGGGQILLKDLQLPATPESPQNTSFSTATSSGVSSGASSTTTAAAAAIRMQTLKDALASNGEMQPKQEPLSREGSESGLDLNGRPPVPLCAICSADSTGIHFGVEACAACSAFFRRTVVLNKNYECPKGGECVTHKDTAGSQRCRSCRFKKCITVGMDRGAVQHRRDAIGKVSQIKKEGSPPLDEEMTTGMGMMVSASYHNQMTPSTSQPVYTQSSILDEWMKRHHKLNKSRKIFYNTDNLAEAFEERKNLTPVPTEMANFSECIYQLWRIEPRLVAMYVNDNVHIVHLSAREKAALFKNFFLAFQAIEEPFLTWEHALDGLDKMWVMPNRMYFCFKNISTYFASNVMYGLNLDMATAVRIFIPSFKNAITLVAEPMKKLAVTYLEMVALSAIIYLDPNAVGISDETKVYLRGLRGDLLACLLQYYRDTRDQWAEEPEIRIAMLLDITSGIKIHAERTRENMQILSLFDVIPCDKLFNEMCNIQSAYNNETRSRLRDRAIKEELVDPTLIEKSDVKWNDYQSQMASGIIPRGADMSEMKGYKNEPMTAPIFARDCKEQAQQQMAMMAAAKKEEPDRDSSPGSSVPSVAPAVALAAAAAAPLLQQQQQQPAFSMASFMQLQQQQPQMAVNSAAAAAAERKKEDEKRRATVATMAMSSHRANQQRDNQTLVNSILNGQQKAEMVQRQLEEDRSHRFIINSQSANEHINYARMMDATEASIALQQAKQQQQQQQAAMNASAAEAVAALRAAQQDSGPSTAKRARMSLVDSGTNPVTPPTSAATTQMMAAALASATQMQQLQPMQQLQQLQQPHLAMPATLGSNGNAAPIPLNMLPPQLQQQIQLQMLQQQAQQNQQLQQQHSNLQLQLLLNSLQQQQHQPVVSLASLQQQLNQQHPY